MSSYAQWREEFVFNFARAFPAARFGHAQAFLRHASADQKSNEIQCSIRETEEQTAKREKADERRHTKLVLLAEEIGAKLETNGDPRGWPLNLISESGARIGVPGKGLPARCFR